jgi:hypothetical protein
VTLFVDGQEVQKGRVERTHSTVFSTDAVGEVGDKHGSPLAADIGPGGNRWTGKIGWVRIDLEPR